MELHYQHSLRKITFLDFSFFKIYLQGVWAILHLFFCQPDCHVWWIHWTVLRSIILQHNWWHNSVWNEVVQKETPLTLLFILMHIHIIWLFCQFPCWKYSMYWQNKWHVAAHHTFHYCSKVTTLRMKFFVVFRVFVYLVCLVLTLERCFQSFSSYFDEHTGINMNLAHIKTQEYPRYENIHRLLDMTNLFKSEHLLSWCGPRIFQESFE